MKIAVINNLSAEFVSSCLDYNAETGLLHWKVRPLDQFGEVRAWKTFNTRFARTQAGATDTHGYTIIALGGKRYKAHRLAWLISHGEWPDETIDHINSVPSDNRLLNLRLASQAQNTRNKSAHGSSGQRFKGVRRNKGEWAARIMNDRKEINLGRFHAEEDAAKACDKAAVALFGEFAKTNFTQ